MAGLSFFTAGLMRDCGTGQKIWRDFGIEKKSGSGLAQKISRDYGKSTKILRDSGIKIVSGSGIETKFIVRYGIYDKTFQFSYSQFLACRRQTTDFYSFCTVINLFGANPANPPKKYAIPELYKILHILISLMDKSFFEIL